VWDAASGKLLHTLAGHEAAAGAVSYSSDGARLAGAFADGTVTVWDALTGQEQFTRRGHPGAVRGVGFSPDGKRVASGGDGLVKVRDATAPPAP
jgi:WD40 repeat protein